jgi:ketose-bisphosphate aldolase
MSTLKQIVSEYYIKRRALLAFNIQNVQQLRCLKHTQSETGCSAIAQISAKYIPYFEEIIGLKQMIDKFQNNGLFFHLDHCLDLDLIEQCIKSGFASVMYDGSSLPISQNIATINGLQQHLKHTDVMLEVELGAIKGVEDGFGDHGGTYFSTDELHQLLRFATFDWLALAIGNAHGIYTSLDEVKIGKLEEARSICGDTPFVLHGGTGLPDEMILQAIAAGVVKINVSTALKLKQFEINKTFSAEHSVYDEQRFYNFMLEKMNPFFRNYLDKFTIA